MPSPRTEGSHREIVVREVRKVHSAKPALVTIVASSGLDAVSAVMPGEIFVFVKRWLTSAATSVRLIGTAAALAMDSTLAIVMFDDVGVALIFRGSPRKLLALGEGRRGRQDVSTGLE